MNTDKDKIKALEDFKKKCEKLDLKQLQKLEQEYIKKMDAKDKEVAEKMFDLPEFVTDKDTNEPVTYETVAIGIRRFLDRQTITWQYTLGMVVLYEFWNPDRYPGKVNYPTLDSTLRTLGELQFTGYDDWKAVVAINKYIEPLREEYIDITDGIYELASYHNVIMDAMKLVTPLDELSK